MAHVKKVRTSAGNLCYYLIDDANKSTPCGSGDDGRRLAEAALGKYNAEKYAGKHGLERHASKWTLDELKREDIKDCTRRGLTTIQPQPNGKISYRETQWNQLMEFFRGETNLDEITIDRLDAYAAARMESVGPATINRNLGVLRKALRYATTRRDSGYRKNPFEAWIPCDEKSVRRSSIVLTPQQRERLLHILEELDPKMRAAVELLMETASRSGQQAPEIVGGDLVYEKHKKGLRRTFTLEGRIAELIAEPRAWSKPVWKQAAAQFQKEFGLSIRPHDLRHTEASLEFLNGATVEDVQQLLGHTTPTMAQRLYIHLFPRKISRKGTRHGNVTEISRFRRAAKSSVTSTA